MQVSLTQILPADIGVAAAYEAYRYWKHHNRILFAPLGGVVDREKEALVGIALAEGTSHAELCDTPLIHICSSTQRVRYGKCQAVLQMRMA